MRGASENKVIAMRAQRSALIQVKTMKKRMHEKHASQAQNCAYLWFAAAPLSPAAYAPAVWATERKSTSVCFQGMLCSAGNTVKSNKMASSNYFLF